MAIGLRDYSAVATQAFNNGGRVLCPDNGDGQPVRAARVNGVGWLVIWFQDRLCSFLTNRLHTRILQNLENTIQNDQKCPIKEHVSEILDRSFNNKSRKRSWLFVKRLQQVSEQLSSAIDDPLLGNLNGEEMVFTSDTYPTEKNFSNMLASKIAAFENQVASKKGMMHATAKNTTQKEINDRNSAALREMEKATKDADVLNNWRREYIHFLEDVYWRQAIEDRAIDVNEPATAFAAFLNYKLALPSPSQGKTEAHASEIKWDKKIDGAFYGCKSNAQAQTYHDIYRSFHTRTMRDEWRDEPLPKRNNIDGSPASGATPERQEDAAILQQKPSIEIAPLAPTPQLPEQRDKVAIEGSDLSSTARSMQGSQVRELLQEGVRLKYVANLAKEARLSHGRLNKLEGAHEITVVGKSRFGRIVTWFRDKFKPQKSIAKNKRIANTLKPILREQFGYGAETANNFVQARFPDALLANTPGFISKLDKTTQELRDNEELFKKIGESNLKFKDDGSNLPTATFFKARSQTLLPLLYSLAMRDDRGRGGWSTNRVKEAEPVVPAQEGSNPEAEIGIAGDEPAPREGDAADDGARSSKKMRRLSFGRPKSRNKDGRRASETGGVIAPETKEGEKVQAAKTEGKGMLQSAEIGIADGAANGDDDPAVRAGDALEKADFDAYKNTIDNQNEEQWGKFIDFMVYLDQNMDNNARLTDREKETDIALSVFLLHGFVKHGNINSDIYSDINVFTDYRHTVIANYADCHKRFSQAL